MTKIQALHTVMVAIERVGGGYHVDNRFADYVDSFGNPSFSDVDAACMQKSHDEAVKTLGTNVYKIALVLYDAIVGGI